MQDQIKIAINRLNQERKLVKERQNSVHSEFSQNLRTGSQMQKLITLDLPKQYKQTIEVSNMKSKRPLKVNNKLKLNANIRRHSRSFKTEKNSNPMLSIVKKFDLSFLNYDPLPIVYYNQGKMLKLRRQSSNVIRV